MKTFFTTVLLLVSFYFGKAQEHKNVEITYVPNTSQSIHLYQFKNGKPRIVQKIWYGKQINFCVYSNPYLYDVFIASRQSSDEEITDSVATKAFSEFATSSLTEVKSATTKTTSADASTKPAAAVVPQQQNKLHDVLSTSTIDSIQIRYNLPENYALKSFNYYINTPNLKGSELSASKAIEQLYQDSRQVASNDSEYVKKRKSFDTAAVAFSAAVKGLKEYTQPYTDVLLIILTDNENSAQIIQKLNERLAYYPQILSIDSFIIKAPYAVYSLTDDINSTFGTLKTEYQKLADLSGSYSKAPMAFKYDSIQFMQYCQADSLITAADLEKTTQELKNMIDVIKDSNSFRHYYHPVSTMKDTLFYSVRLKPSKRYDSLLAVYNKPMYAIDSFEYPIPIKGAFKLNFSVGAAFLQHNLRNFSYYFNPNKDLITDADSIQISQGRQNNKFRPVVTAFAHAYFNLKSESQLTPAITIGISANPVDLNNVSYLLGGSLIFGHKNRFIATAGIAGASVDYLKGKYQNDKNYISRQFTGLNETDLTEKVFKTGFFFGFSYNISNSR